MSIKSFITKLRDFITADVKKSLNDILWEIYISNNYKNLDPKSLNNFEYQVYSQNGEDGIISEIFRRIGTTNKFFVEFGVGDGLENNSTFLLIRGWKGVWIEADNDHIRKINDKFGFLINKGYLLVKNAFINSKNIENLFIESNVPKEFDLLSIDIDGNDYWIWKSIVNFDPRVVIIEYNSILPPDAEWIMKYNESHIWNGTSYFGASLKSLEKLGREKGYTLVCCDFLGVNAFFVKSKLISEEFLSPRSTTNIYQSPKYHHMSTKSGHPRDFGEFETDFIDKI